MLFGMTNPSAGFPEYNNNTIREVLIDFASGYVERIIIYSNIEEKHMEYIKWIVMPLVLQLYFQDHRWSLNHFIYGYLIRNHES